MFKNYDQNQTLLLPTNLQEFIPQDHLARIISDVVDLLDLSEVEKGYKRIGANAFHPKMMIKILVYAYSQKIFSSRKIAAYLKTDVAFMYLAARQTPDFRTISIFRKKHLKNIENIFIEVLVLCKNLGMIHLGEISLDGSKIKANASIKESKNMDRIDKRIKRLEEEVHKLLDESVKLDHEEDEKYGDSSPDTLPKDLIKRENRIKKLKEAKKALKKNRDKNINITDHDAKIMKIKNKGTLPGYNCQIAVQSNNQLIVAADVVTDASDYRQLQPIVKQVKKNLGVFPKKVNADSGFCTYDSLEYLEENNIDGYMPDKIFESKKSQKFRLQKNKGEKKFSETDFCYSADKDEYLCPNGQTLRFKFFREKRGIKNRIYVGENCSSCTVKNACTNVKNRSITRHPKKNLVEQMREKLLSPEGKNIYKRRRHTVEPPFGNIKYNIGLDEFNLRGKENVKIEFLLTCIIHNIMKIGGFIQEKNQSLSEIFMINAN